MFLYLVHLVEHGPAEQVFNRPRETRKMEDIKGTMS
jgi:ABC-type phosphate transport system ATPase subunit